MLDDQPLTFNFDVPMSPWPDAVRLTDPRLELDLITAKLFVFYCQEPRPVGWADAGSARADWKVLLNFLRWRIDRGVASNSSLSEEWHREYVASIKAGTTAGLLRVKERLETLLQAERDGLVHFPRDSTKRLATNVVAHLLGLSNATQIAGDARSILNAYLESNGLRTNSGKPLSQIEATGEQIVVRTETAVGLLKPWLQLWNLREYLSHDPIGVQAYRNLREIRRSIKKWATPGDVTLTCP